MASCALAVQVASAQYAPEDLLAYWDFDSVGAHTDLTAGQNQASPDARDLTFNANAAITPDAGGRSGAPGDYGLDTGTLNDQSNAKTAVGDHFDELATNGTYTITWWQFRRQTGNSSSFWMHAPTAPNNQRGIQGHVPWSNGIIYWDQNGATAPAGRLQIGGGLLDTLNQWDHLAFVRDQAGNTRKMYLNGAEVGSADAGTALAEFDGILTIGSEGPNNGNSFNGVYDEFAVFRVALTAGEVASLADESQTPLSLVFVPPGSTKIVLAGNQTEVIERGLGYTDAGVSDVLDLDTENSIAGAAGDVIIDASAVDANTVGSYVVTFTYTATPPKLDSSTTRRVTVVDTTPGTLALNDNTPAANEIVAGSGPWVDPGATAVDANVGDALVAYSSALKPTELALGKWTFDDDTAADSSVNRNDGREFGTPTYSTDTPYGIPGKSIDFTTGNSGVEISDGTANQSTFDIKPYFASVPDNQLEMVGPWNLESTAGTTYVVDQAQSFVADNDQIDAAVLADPGVAVSQSDAINFGNGNEGRILFGTPGPIEGLDNVSFRATGTLRVLVEDDYLIGSQNDDGFSLLIETGGAQFDPALVESLSGGRVIRKFTTAPVLVNDGSLGATADFGGAPLSTDPWLDGGDNAPLFGQAGALVDPTVPGPAFDNSSIAFPGAEFVDTPNNPALNVVDADLAATFPGAAAEFSIEFWAKPSGAGDLLGAVSNIVFEGTSRAGWLFYQRPDDSWEFRVGDGAGYINPLAGNAGEIVHNQWNHVVGVLRLDKSNPAAPVYHTDLYVNGVLANTVTLDRPPTVNAVGPLRLGATVQNAAFGAARFFNGCLDEIAVYGASLDAATVLSHYENGTNSPSARTQTYPDLVTAGNPLGYWRGEDAAPALDTNVTGLYAPAASGNSSTVGRIRLTPGDYPIKFIMREGGGGEHSEVFSRRDVPGETEWLPLTNGGVPGVAKGGLMYISFFAKKNGWGDNWGAFVSKQGEAGLGWQVRRLGSENKVTFTRRGAGNDDPATGTITDVPDGNWHHIMVALDGDNVRQWIDGRLDYSFPSSGIVNAAVGYSLAFGSRDGTVGPGDPAASWYRGQMDEICIYDTPLTDEQLFAHVSGGEAVNTNVPGEYNVRYVALDESGNSTTISRTVTVLPNPALPVITLVGDAVETVEASLSPYAESGATAATGPGAAAPGVELGAAVVSGTVDRTTVGTYVLTYDYTDGPNGTALPVIRVVKVIDTTAPVITLNGAATLTIKEGELFVDPGATTSDIVDGAGVAVSNNINPAALIGNWTFDNDGTSGDVNAVIDDSGNGYTGTLIGGGTYINDVAAGDVAVAGGRALDLSGGDHHVLIEGSQTIADFQMGSGPFSVSCWVKGWPDGDWEPFVSKRGEGQGWQLRRRGGGRPMPPSPRVARERMTIPMLLCPRTALGTISSEPLTA